MFVIRTPLVVYDITKQYFEYLMNFDFDNKHPFRWESIRFNNRGKTGGHTTKNESERLRLELEAGQLLSRCSDGRFVKIEKIENQTLCYDFVANALLTPAKRKRHLC